jgi:hypothetical protein
VHRRRSWLMGSAVVAVVVALNAPIPALASTGLWTEHSLTWSIPGYTNSDLENVSCADGTCVAVGYAQTASLSQSPLVELDSSGTWERVNETMPAGVDELSWRSVSCVNATQCFAIGEAITNTSSEMAMLDRDGTSWTISMLPTLDGWSSPNRNSISCSGETCVAVGAAEIEAASTPIVETLSGGTWVATQLASPTGDTTSQLLAISCADATDCTAIGTGNTNSTSTSTPSSPVLYQWSSDAWNSQVISFPAGVTVDRVGGISCWSPTLCDASASSSGDTAVVLKITGMAVAYDSLPLVATRTFAEFNSISCLSATACVMTGSSGAVGGWDGITAALTGTTWTQTLIDPPVGDNEPDIASVVCQSKSSCIAVGSDGSQSQQSTDATLFTLVGSTWSQSAIVVAGQSSATLYGISCASARSCVAVGMFEDVAGGDVPFVESLTSAGWLSSKPAMPKSARAAGLFGVSCPKLGSCVAVGQYVAPSGTLLPYADVLTSGTWTSVAVPSKSGFVRAGLDGVSCTTTTSCVAVGTLAMRVSTDPWCSGDCTETALVEQLVGTKWTASIPTSPKSVVNPSLTAVDCFSSRHCVAVGTYFSDRNFLGDVETLDGSSWHWSSASAPAGGVWAELNGVACSSATACELVGDFEASNGSSQFPLAVTGSDSGPWTATAPTGTVSSMWGDYGGVTCPSATSCTAVGTNGTDTLVSTLAFGKWSTDILALVASDDTDVLDAISCPAAGACHSVGESFGTSGDVPLVANN